MPDLTFHSRYRGFNINLVLVRKEFLCKIYKVGYTRYYDAAGFIYELLPSRFAKAKNERVEKKAIREAEEYIDELLEQAGVL